jgi:hypothetical protein
MANQPSATIIRFVPGISFQKYPKFRLNRLLDQTLCARSQKIGQWIRQNPCGSGSWLMVSLVMWHILFSVRIAARQQRNDIPPLRGHHQLLAIARIIFGLVTSRFGKRVNYR